MTLASSATLLTWLCWLAAPAAATPPATTPGFAPAPPADTATPPTATPPTATPTFAPAPPAATPDTTAPTATDQPARPTPVPTTTTTPAQTTTAAIPTPRADAPEPPPLPVSPSSFPPPAPPPANPPRRYGDAGSMELGLALGYTQQSGFVGGGAFRRFVVDSLAPGVEASVQRGTGLTTGLVLASLKWVPFRGDNAALVITGRAGRVLLSDHPDGWGAGGGAGVIFFFSPGVGLELGYAILWLEPSHFCADLTSCRIEGPELGLRVAF